LEGCKEPESDGLNWINGAAAYANGRDPFGRAIASI
jgi:hypothetical protein